MDRTRDVSAHSVIAQRLSAALDIREARAREGAGRALERFRSKGLCSLQRRGSTSVKTADTPQPGADLQPIDTPPAAPEKPERQPPSIPEEDDPEIEKTEEQPS